MSFELVLRDWKKLTLIVDAFRKCTKISYKLTVVFIRFPSDFKETVNFFIMCFIYFEILCVILVSKKIEEKNYKVLCMSFQFSVDVFLLIRTNFENLELSELFNIHIIKSFDF